MKNSGMRQEVKRLDKGQYYWTVFVDEVKPILQKVMETNHAFDEERYRLGLYFVNEEDAVDHLMTIRHAREEAMRREHELKLSRERSLRRDRAKSKRK